MQFDNNIPIYLQIADLIRRQIVSGELCPGERIPSVRDFAVSMKANPNTITKALAELENERLIFTERTNGKFVTFDQTLISSAQLQIAANATEEYLKNMRALGLSDIQILKCIKKIKGGKTMHDAILKSLGGVN